MSDIDDIIEPIKDSITNVAGIMHSQQNEIEALRSALELIADGDPEYKLSETGMVYIAKDALKGKTNET